jgi:hypothetical protein
MSGQNNHEQPPAEPPTGNRGETAGSDVREPVPEESALPPLESVLRVHTPEPATGNGSETAKPDRLDTGKGSSQGNPEDIDLEHPEKHTSAPSLLQKHDPDEWLKE